MTLRMIVLVVAGWKALSCVFAFSAIQTTRVYFDGTVEIGGRYFGFQERDRRLYGVSSIKVSTSERDILWFLGQRHLGSRYVTPISLRTLTILLALSIVVLMLIIRWWRVVRRRKSLNGAWLESLK
jgi:hypothetical protein